MNGVRTVNSVTVGRERPDQPGVLRLLDASDAFAASLYPAESNHLVDVATLLQPNVRFLVARVGDLVVGCGAIVLHTEEPANSYAEIKRMFVAEQARGRAAGRQILNALETEAVDAGAKATRLETGVLNRDAIRLYERSGYRRIGPFGDYWDDPLSLFYEKQLTKESRSEV